LQLLERIAFRRAILVTNLCPARDTRLHDMALTVEGNLPREFLDELRTLRARSLPSSSHRSERSITAAARRASSA
jgi:hypothetical protein